MRNHEIKMSSFQTHSFVLHNLQFVSKAMANITANGLYKHGGISEMWYHRNM